MIVRRGAVALVATAFALQPGLAHAEFGGPNSTTVQVGSTSSGPTVTAGSAGYGSTGIEATASSQTSEPIAYDSGYSGPTYTYAQIPYNTVPTSGAPQVNNQGVITIPPGGFQDPCPPGQTAYYMYGPSGNGLGVICVPNTTNTFPANGSPAVQLAEEASSLQKWPQLVMGVNPTTGLTGLSSWFWLAGGSPKMRDATATAGPLTVTVRATFLGVTWEYGDGSSYDSSDLGQAYPAESDVQHVYQTDTYGMAQGYTVTALLRYQVSYATNGGRFLVLGIKTRAFTEPYVVYQEQPEAVPPS